MTQWSDGPLEAPPAARSLWQRFYAAVVARARARTTARARALPRPVISVGNLHWGGAGKTPFTLALAHRLSGSSEFPKRRVCVLSRGYKRRAASRHPELIVARGDGTPPLVGPDEAGDEPHLLARRLPAVSVVVGTNRYRAGQLALRDLDVDLFVLDDAFSHWRLHRDLDILLFPFAGRHGVYGGGRLLPSGRLREPLTHVRFADALVLTGVPGNEQSRAAAAQNLRRGLSAYPSQAPVFAAGSGVNLDTGMASPTDDGSPPFLLVTGIANGSRVAESARALGLEVAEHLEFPDHHSYPERSVRRILAALERRQPTDRRRGLLTTEKDEAKLRLRLPPSASERLRVLRIEVHPQNEFWRWLEEGLQKAHGS